MKTYILGYCLSVLILISCSNNVDCYNVAVSQGFVMEDSTGKDLLDPDEENTMNTNKLNIYYIVDGEKVRVPFSIYLFEENYLLSINLNDSDRSNYAIIETCIEWNEFDTDTIVSKISNQTCNFSSTIIQFNDSIWSPPVLASDTRSHFFKIIK